MGRVLILVGLVGFAGCTLVLSELRWFRRPRMADRLVPYAPGSETGRREMREALYSSGGRLNDVQHAAENMVPTTKRLMTVRRYCDRLTTGKSARSMPLK